MLFCVHEICEECPVRGIASSHKAPMFSPGSASIHTGSTTSNRHHSSKDQNPRGEPGHAHTGTGKKTPRVCPVCVPAPPVSFYRFKDTGGDGNPQSRRTPHAHDLRFETFRSAVQYRVPVNKHGVARAVWPCRIRPMSSLSMSWWRSFPIKRSRSTPKPCSSIGSISPIRMVMVASHWMTSFPGR